jgi:hypothetical protein
MDDQWREWLDWTDWAAQRGPEQPVVKRRRVRSGPVPGSKRARNGGNALRDRYGVEHFREIGKRGAEAAHQRHGPERHVEDALGGAANAVQAPTDHDADTARLEIGQQAPTRAVWQRAPVPLTPSSAYHVAGSSRTASQRSAAVRCVSIVPC